MFQIGMNRNVMENAFEWQIENTKKPIYMNISS